MMRLLLLLFSMMIVLMLGWAYAEPLANHNAFWLNGLFMSLPLLLCSPALWRPTRNGIVMLSLVDLLYFVHACVGLYAPSGSRWWSMTEMMIVLALFVQALRIARVLNAAENGGEK